MSSMKEAMDKAGLRVDDAPKSAVPLNTTGIHPVEFKVLIMLEPVQEKLFLILPLYLDLPADALANLVELANDREHGLCRIAA